MNQAEQKQYLVSYARHCGFRHGAKAGEERFEKVGRDGQKIQLCGEALKRVLGIGNDRLNEAKIAARSLDPAAETVKASKPHGNLVSAVELFDNAQPLAGCFMLHVLCSRPVLKALQFVHSLPVHVGRSSGPH